MYHLGYDSETIPFRGSVDQHPVILESNLTPAEVARLGQKPANETPSQLESIDKRNALLSDPTSETTNLRDTLLTERQSRRYSFIPGFESRLHERPSHNRSHSAFDARFLNTDTTRDVYDFAVEDDFDDLPVIPPVSDRRSGEYALKKGDLLHPVDLTGAGAAQSHDVPHVTRSPRSSARTLHRAKSPISSARKSSRTVDDSRYEIGDEDGVAYRSNRGRHTTHRPAEAARSSDQYSTTNKRNGRIHAEGRPDLLRVPNSYGPTRTVAPVVSRSSSPSDDSDSSSRDDASTRTRDGGKRTSTGGQRPNEDRPADMPGNSMPEIYVLSSDDDLVDSSDYDISHRSRHRRNSSYTLKPEQSSKYRSVSRTESKSRPRTEPEIRRSPPLRSPTRTNHRSSSRSPRVSMDYGRPLSREHDKSKWRTSDDSFSKDNISRGRASGTAEQTQKTYAVRPTTTTHPEVYAFRQGGGSRVYPLSHEEARPVANEQTFHVSPPQPVKYADIQENHTNADIRSYRQWAEHIQADHITPPASCRRSTTVTNNTGWMTLETCPVFDICPECFHASVASTRYASHFVPSVRHHINGEIVCDYGEHIWYRIALLVSELEGYRDLRLMNGIAHVIATSPKLCLGKDEAVQEWFSIIDPTTRRPVFNFDVCISCVRSIEAIFPNLSQIFVRIPPEADPRVCDMRYDSRRFVNYFALLMEMATSDPNSRYGPDTGKFARLAKRYTFVNECLGDVELRKWTWWTIPQIPEFTVCEECYQQVILPEVKLRHPIPNMFSRKEVRGMASCQLHESRMRELFLTATQRDDYSYLDEKFRERKFREEQYKRDVLWCNREIYQGVYGARERKVEIEREWREWQKWQT